MAGWEHIREERKTYVDEMGQFTLLSYWKSLASTQWESTVASNM